MPCHLIYTKTTEEAKQNVQLKIFCLIISELYKRIDMIFFKIWNVILEGSYRNYKDKYVLYSVNIYSLHCVSSPHTDSLIQKQ